MINHFQDEKTVKLRSYEKTRELGRILGLEGTLEILLLLDERPRQYKEIDAEHILPQTTLNRRLKMLQTVGIIKKFPISSDRRETHQYTLTLKGIELMKFIKSYEKALSLPLSQQKIEEY